MKKQILLFVLMLLPMVASAFAGEAVIDGIKYYIITKAQTAEVRANGYSGSVVIPSTVIYEGVKCSVTSIGSWAFDGCSGLTSVTIPNSVTSIGNSAFYDCRGLTSVTIPNSVTSIGSWAFDGCSGLTSVTIGNSVTFIGESAFSSCSGLTSVTIPNSVTSIGSWAFDGCSGLTSVTIPNSVTSIGESAFYGCSGLTSVTIGNNVTSIGRYTFHNCSGLTSVTIGNSVTFIGESAFSGCSGLTSVTIPNSVTTIGDDAFYDCSGLTSVTIPNSVTSIGESAFLGCSGLKSVHISDLAAWCKISFSDYDTNPLYYAKHLYMNGTEVKDLVIPNSVTSIGDNAFRSCSGLTSVTIPNSVTSIGDNAFRSCSGLTSVTIPNSVTSIGESAFLGCSGLMSVHISDLTAWCKISFSSSRANPLYYAKHLYMNGTEVKDLVIPNSVTSIGGSAFSGCSGLTSVTIPNSVTSIGDDAFYGCSGLTSVTIGSAVKNIYYSAFARCSDLTDVYCYAEKVPSTSSDTFQDSYIEYATLHVPEASIDLYKSESPWNQFKNIVAIGGDSPETKTCSKPTIRYKNGKLSFACETEGATFRYNIADDDIKSGTSSQIQLTATYTITVHASKAGYKDSETATATLCWIDVEPKKEGMTDGIANVPAHAVMIQSNGGTLTIQGADDGTPVSVYGVNGTQEGSAIISSGIATIRTHLQPGSIAIVKIGQKSVKVALQ